LISIEIEGKPIAWKAARVLKSGRTYSEHTKRKQGIQWELKSKFDGPLLEGPIHLSLSFYFLPAKKASKKDKANMLKGLIHYTKKPDVSNLVKFIEDCCTQTIWVDDRQIISVTAEKSYDTRERTEIFIEEVPLWTA